MRTSDALAIVAAVIVAIVGNAAEHGGAVVVAYRGRIKLAAEIALASSAQVAVFLIPAVVVWTASLVALDEGKRAISVIRRPHSAARMRRTASGAGTSGTA